MTTPHAGAPSALPAPADARRSLIRDTVRSAGSVTVEELVQATGVSRMTVHRDLDALEAEGVLRKVRGGATATRSSVFESDLQFRLTQATAAKEAIARAAASFIDVGQAVLLDESTTALATLRTLDPHEPLTVITNCVPTMNHVMAETQHRLICLGGDYVARYQAFLGILCEQTIRDVYADVLLASCSATRGLQTFHQDSRIVGVKRAMVAAAPTRILLLDSSKIDVGAVYQLGSVTDFTHVIVDEAAPDAFVAAVRDAGVEVVLAHI